MSNQSRWSLRAAVPAVFAAGILAAGASRAQAQAAGFQEFFVLGHEGHVWNFMERVRQGEGAAAFPAPARMHSVVSITATVDDQVISYDHWENGFDAGNPPVPGATTLVFGDNNAANGRVCDWTLDPRVICGTADQDRLFAGTFLTLGSDRGLGCGDPSGLRCSVPIPRVSTDVRFDGGDRVYTTGSAVTIAHIQDPGTPLIGGGTELLARALVEPAVAFSVPIGENQYPGANNAFNSVRYVSLNLVAFDDNTSVTVTSPGVGSVSFVLNRGQHWSSCAQWSATGPPQTCTAGAIDGTVSAALALQINSGTKVSTTGPLNGLMFTGGVGSYQTRHYGMLPDILHSTDYVITAPGDNTGVQGTRALNLYVFNPDPVNTVTVRMVDTGAGSPFTINIPPNSVIDYRNARGFNVPNNATVRLTSTNGRNFWGVSVYGYTDNISDWGHSWLATRFLTSDYTAAYSPGTQPVAVTQISRVGTTATATTAIPITAIWGAVGTVLQSTVTGASVAQFNGIKTVTVASANTFTFTVANSGATLDTALITAQAGPCDAGASGTGVGCNSFNRDPMWVAGIQDNTQVRIDLADTDNLWNYVDTDGDNCPNDGDAAFNEPACEVPPVVAGCPALTANRCVYRVNAPGNATNNVLRIFDYTDFSNEGTRVVTNRPVSISWGQDVDQGQGNDPSPDNGYTIYPLNDLFVDPVLSLVKTPDVTYIPLAGGTVTYTLRASTHSFGPIDNVVIRDLLPAFPAGATYVPGSTLVTYPNLTQSTADPTTATVSGRTQLTWALSPSTMASNQVVTVRYQVQFPASGSPVSIVNDAEVTGNLGTSFFRARDSATVAQTAVTLVKSQSTSLVQVGDTITYSLVVTNGGNLAETNLLIVDPIPAGTTFSSLPAAPAPFTGTYSPGQNAVIWTAASLAAGQSRTLTVSVTVNPTTPRGTQIPNTASYESDQAPPFDSNTVIATVVAPELVRSKMGGPSPLHPNEIVTFEVTVDNVGDAPATGVRIFDPFPVNATYMPGTMSWRQNAGPYVPLTDAADADGGTVLASGLELLVASLGPGADVHLRFQARVNPGTAGLFVPNQATITSNETPPGDTNLVQIPILGSATATLTGHVFLDLDGDGTQDAGEPNIPNVNVVVTDSLGATQTAVTDASGNYTVSVPPGSTSLNVDETDPDFPFGATLTTANDPQNVVAVANVSTPSTPVGYQPPPVSITKASNPIGHQVIEGQEITYTVTVTNNTTVTQTGIAVTDAVPTGTTYVPASTQVSVVNQQFRVTEYFIAPGTFAGTTHTVTLNNNLMANYFAIVQGSDGDDDTTTDRTPSDDYVSLTNDPFGTGDFTGGIAANQLVLSRGSASNTVPGDSWAGVVTVVECLFDCANAAGSGFRLLDVQRVAHTGANVTGTDTSAVAWSNINQVMLMGGFNGSGCDTADGDAADHKSCHARLFPSGTNTINWTRSAGGATSLSAATSTVMVLEWGTGWTVQRRVIGDGTGGGAAANNGGDGINAAGEYNTVAINQVARANTWVWGTGHTNDQSIGEASEGVAITLGNGVTQNANETTIAVGLEVNNNDVEFDVYALTHPQLSVQHLFKADGNNTDLVVDLGTNAVASNRMALAFNSSDQVDSNDNQYPRPMFSARYLDDDTIRLQRRRDDGAGGGADADFAAWVQGLGWSTIGAGSSAAGHAPSGLVIPSDGYSLGPGGVMTVTYRVTVDRPLAAGITTIDNTATIATTQNPTVRTSNTVTDTVIRPVVVVEYDNAGFTTAGAPLTYHHFVVNTGAYPDSFTITATTELGWPVELLDPNTGAVLATDANGDGVWDGGVTVNTGTLATNAFAEYAFRVTPPGGAAVATQQTIRLFATSDRDNLVNDNATDETTIVAAPGSGTVQLFPDNSGVVLAGESVVYTHRVLNTTGLTDTFDLIADSSQGWGSTIYFDSNGDGVYTPGVDVQVNNSPQLANNASAVFFVVVTAPPGTPQGTVDVTHLTAWSRRDPTIFDGATDTTTVVMPDAHDLSGGGTRDILAGQTARFPGTLSNLGPQTRFNFEITASSFFGVDNLLHPTQLWVDTNSDGTPDTQIALDSDGDGDWDTILGGYDVDNDSRPDVLMPSGIGIAGGSLLNYELRRPIDLNQGTAREHVTFTAEATTGAGDSDSVTATVLLAALSRASIRGIKVDPEGLVEFVTGMQRGTRSFNLYELPSADAFGQRSRLNADPIEAPVADAMTPTFYEVRTRALTQPFLLIEEIEVKGTRRFSGPFSVTDPRLRRAYERLETRLFQSGETATAHTGWRRFSEDGLRRMGRRERAAVRQQLREEKQKARDKRSRARARTGLKVEVVQGGYAQVPFDRIQDALPEATTKNLVLSHRGAAVPFQITADAAGARWVGFEAQGLVTDYTEANAYVFTLRKTALAPQVELTRSAAPPTPGSVRVEKNQIYESLMPFGNDPWLWDALFPGYGSWPYPWSWIADVNKFDIPNLVPGAGNAAVRIRLFGWSEHDHLVEARINGVSIGSLSFSGRAPGLLLGSVPLSALRTAGNELTLDYAAVSVPGGPAPDWGVVGLDYLEIDAPTSRGTAVLGDFDDYDATLPDFGGVQYLVVTHPVFREAADRVAALKTASGLRAAVVEVDTAYDAFSSGIVEANAVRALIARAAKASGALKYVLLMGDDTFDPNDYSGYGGGSFVPSLAAWDGAFGRIPSENRYADLDGDGRPDLAIGRLPVQTAEQAAVAVNKIAAHMASSRPAGQAQLFVADNATETDSPFRENAERMAAQLPAGSVRWVDLSAGASAARTELVGAWSQAPLAAHYFGHGGVDKWADEDLLSSDDAESLVSARPPVVFNWACETNWYQYLYGASLGEALVLAERGAVASFGPTGISAPAAQRELYEEVYKRLAAPNPAPLGEVIRAAKAAARAKGDHVQPVVDGWSLLGDPSLRLWSQGR